MTNETPGTLKQLLQILEKQGTANDDVTKNSRDHWRKIAAKGLTRGRFKCEPCVICNKIGEMHHHNYRKPYEVTWLCNLHHRQLHALEQKLKRDKQWPIRCVSDALEFCILSYGAVMINRTYGVADC
jgi:hypothetical protein